MNNHSFYKEEIEGERTINKLASMQEMELGLKPSISVNKVFLLYYYPIGLNLLSLLLLTF